MHKVRARRRDERGQIILMFAGALVVILAMAGLLIDGGFLMSTQRQAQAAADTGALAAAKAASTGGNATAAARAIANTNGYPTNLVDCDGVEPGRSGRGGQPAAGRERAVRGAGQLRRGDHQRARRTPSSPRHSACPASWCGARAVAQIGAAEVATCNFCVLTEWAGDGSDDPFLMNNTGHLRVDGDIQVNGKAITGPCTPSGAFGVCGKALHLFRNGGTPGDITFLSARTIAVAGGWESLGGTRAQADTLAEDVADGTPCNWHPDPNGYAAAGYPSANVCVGMVPIDDPFNDPDDPLNLTGARIDPPDAASMDPPQEGVNGCPIDGYDATYPDVVVPTGTLGIPAKLNLSGSPPGEQAYTICPGLYYGGFSVNGDFRNVKVKMIPGTYFMVGGGFQVSGTASIDGSAGVTIYNSGGSQSFAHSTPPRDPDLVPDCDPDASDCENLTADLAAASSTNVEVPITYTLTLTAPASLVAPVGGTVDFFDGPDLITSPDCEDVALVPVTGQPRRATATCTITYTEFGTRWITAEYEGDDIFAPVADNKSMTINPNANLGIDDVDICTGSACGASAPCTQDGPCTVVLHAPTSGEYAGLLVFQDRSSSLGLRFWPHFGLAACTGNWMTDGVPTGPNPGAAVPEPCGALGGLSGTIYAPKVRTGGGQWDATVNIQADGVANLQVVAGRIALLYNTDARFAFRPEEFANGAIRLVE